MSSKVTIQDIADALGLSRNTVSKAINNTGILADATRDKILQKAVDMGYKQFSYANLDYTEHTQAGEAGISHKGEIALFTGNVIGNSHFSSTMLDKFQKELSPLGYTLSIHRVYPEDMEKLQLPISFYKERISGIMCIEMFNSDYNEMLCELELPILFVDAPVFHKRPIKADVLLMDNTTNIFSFVSKMVNRGITKIGFIGNHLHCQSFFERYMALRNALYLFGLPCEEKYCFLKDEWDPSVNTNDYRLYLDDCFDHLDELPEVYVCANDFVAIDVLQSLRKKGLSVPSDVMLCGFDDSPESRIVTPPLTSIHIHSQVMGLSAVQLLISRINEPSLNYRTIYNETDLVWRESAKD